jgi:hypothetical protein
MTLHNIKGATNLILGTKELIEMAVKVKEELQEDQQYYRLHEKAMSPDREEIEELLLSLISKIEGLDETKELENYIQSGVEKKKPTQVLLLKPKKQRKKKGKGFPSDF